MAHYRDGLGYDRFDNCFIKENKALLACLDNTLEVSLNKDLSGNIMPKYLYSFTCSNWEPQVGLLYNYFCFFDVN